MFVGREYHIAQLDKLYRSRSSHIAVIYGRRRIGKSSLVEQFAKSKALIKFEGIEGAHTPEQIRQVTNDLARQINDPILNSVHFSKWNDLFEYLTTYLSANRKKVVLFFDEVQWLAANQSLFISLLKKYWDNHWKQENVLLILCGSVSSYMMKRVIRSKALFGRIDLELCLEPLLPKDALQLIGSNRNRDEAFTYLLLLGGIPRYLEMIDSKRSLIQNINELAFTKAGFLTNEYEKIFYSQFREHKNYERIVKHLARGPANLEEISKHVKMPSGGGLKSYLENLEKSLFITAYTPYDRGATSKIKKYKLTDEYLRFYFKYIIPNIKLIQSNTRRNLFKTLVVDQWQSWLGFAFENFCLKNAEVIAETLGFLDHVTSFGPLISRGQKGFQVDLLYLRNDRTVTVCEMKFLDKPVSPSIIPEMEKKMALVKPPKGYTVEKALISRHGASKSLKISEYFEHSISVTDFFQ